MTEERVQIGFRLPPSDAQWFREECEKRRINITDLLATYVQKCRELGDIDPFNLLTTLTVNSSYQPDNSIKLIAQLEARIEEKIAILFQEIETLKNGQQTILEQPQEPHSDDEPIDIVLTDLATPQAPSLEGVTPIPIDSLSVEISHNKEEAIEENVTELDRKPKTLLRSQMSRQLKIPQSTINDWVDKEKWDKFPGWKWNTRRKLFIEQI